MNGILLNTGLVLLIMAAVLSMLTTLLMLGNLGNQQRAAEKAWDEFSQALLDAVSRGHAADVLEAAAQEWDSTEGRVAVDAMARSYRPDGPSVPAIWMMTQARNLREGK